MTCDKFKDLLPFYAEGDISDDDRLKVDDHLKGCASCREALSFFENLETALVSRSEIRPSARRTATAVTERLGLKPRRRFAVSWTGVPALAGFALALVGVILLFVRIPVPDLSAFGSSDFSLRLTALVEKWSLEMAQLGSGGNELVLLSVYSGLFALIMLTGSWMVLRFVRD